MQYKYNNTITTITQLLPKTIGANKGSITFRVWDPDVKLRVILFTGEETLLQSAGEDETRDGSRVQITRE